MGLRNIILLLKHVHIHYGSLQDELNPMITIHPVMAQFAWNKLERRQSVHIKVYMKNDDVNP